MKQKIITLGKIKFSNTLPLVFIGGPCVIEGEKVFLDTAKQICTLMKKAKVPFIFKASFDKANRSSVSAYRGVGIDMGLELLAEVKQKYQVPILTDIHEPYQAKQAAKVADILQIPAFLCRQTDLVLAAAKTGKIINVKKGQFLAPQAVCEIIKKIESEGNKNILLTERGASFGYGDLVVDMRSFEIMRRTGYPVIFDLTHSMQKPAGASTTGGDKTVALTLARAAAGAGIAGLFFEAHPQPEKALSDKANTLSLPELREVVKQVTAIDEVTKCGNPRP